MIESTGRKEHPFAGQGAILLTAVCWSLAGLFIKLIEWHPMVIAGGRSLLAAIFLLTLRIIVTKKGVLPSKPRSLSILIFGSVIYALTMILFVLANKLTTSANAILIQYTSPIWAALLAWYFLKERPRMQHWIALVMVGGGMFLIFFNSIGGGALTGDILALLSGIAFAGNTVILRKAKDQNPADILLGANIITALVSIPFFFLYPPEAGFVNISSIFILGFVQIGAASAFLAYGIQRVTVIQVMLITMMEPVLNPVWVLLFTGERPALTTIAGGAVILLAVVLSSVISWRRNQV